MSRPKTRQQDLRRALPAIDRLLSHADTKQLIDRFGRTLVTDAARATLAEARQHMFDQMDADGGQADGISTDPDSIITRMADWLATQQSGSMRPVFNLTGTIIHTNLGRAPLPQAAIDAMVAAAGAVTLEYDLKNGKRGDRDQQVAARICRLTGAEAATVVNNNAAAVLLLLNSLANRKEVLISRGELVEIGGSFRIPDVMARAGAKMREVGTTNRTHPQDFRDAITSRTALIMKVHTSNYAIKGFTSTVDDQALRALANDHDVIFAHDLGSGILTDPATLGLSAEPTVRDSLAKGADLVTFSGDKLLGGPQAGLIAGRADLIARIRRNPMKRALRMGKLGLAALDATLALYEQPETLIQQIPALRLIQRPAGHIQALAEQLAPRVQRALGALATVDLAPCYSQIGSGALPVDHIASTALVLTPSGPAKQRGRAARQLASAFRALPRPVIGRIADNRLLFDLRCLEMPQNFLAQLPDSLILPAPDPARNRP